MKMQFSLWEKAEKTTRRPIQDRRHYFLIVDSRRKICEGGQPADVGPQTMAGVHDHGNPSNAGRRRLLAENRGPKAGKPTPISWRIHFGDGCKISRSTDRGRARLQNAAK